MRKTALLVTGIFLVAAAILTPIIVAVGVFLVPATFASTTRVSSGFTQPEAIAKELETIRSRDVLYPVITNLHLPEKLTELSKRETNLSLDETYALLRSALVVGRFRDTTLIEITVFQQDMREAALIANEIALVYRDLSIRSPNVHVEIVEKASASFRPARPNKPLSIAGGVAGGVLLATLGVGFIYLSGKRLGSGQGS